MASYLCRHCRNISKSKDIDDTTILMDCTNRYKLKSYIPIDMCNGGRRYRCPKCIKSINRKDWIRK